MVPIRTGIRVKPNNNNGGNSENHVELKVYTDSAGTVSSYWNDVTDDQQQYYVLKTLEWTATRLSSSD